MRFDCQISRDELNWRRHSAKSSLPHVTSRPPGKLFSTIHCLVQGYSDSVTIYLILWQILFCFNFNFRLLTHDYCSDMVTSQLLCHFCPSQLCYIYIVRLSLVSVYPIRTVETIYRVAGNTVNLGIWQVSPGTNGYFINSFYCTWCLHRTRRRRLPRLRRRWTCPWASRRAQPDWRCRYTRGGWTRAPPPPAGCRALGRLSKIVQGDHSGCSLGLVDIKTEAEFQYMILILKHNFCFNVNNT